jgi:hypothetical protein
MTAREADLLLNVRRAQNLRIYDDIRQIAAKAADRPQRKSLRLIAAFIPTT